MSDFVIEPGNASSSGDPNLRLFDSPITKLPNCQIAVLLNLRHVSDQRRSAPLQHAICEYVFDRAQHSDLFLSMVAWSACRRRIRPHLRRSTVAPGGVFGGIAA